MVVYILGAIRSFRYFHLISSLLEYFKMPPLGGFTVGLLSLCWPLEVILFLALPSTKLDLPEPPK